MRLQMLRRELWQHVLAGADRADADIPVETDVYHVLGTVPLAALLAERRGVNRELAVAAMLLHDMGRMVTGKVMDHAAVAVTLGGTLLPEAGFTSEETAAICAAVGGHADKSQTGAPLDEVVRDADVLEVYLSGAPVPEAFRERAARLARELGLRG